MRASVLARLPNRRTGPLVAPDPFRGSLAQALARIGAHATVSAIEGAGPDACPWPLDGRLRPAARVWHRAHRVAVEDLAAEGMTPRPRHDGTTE